MYFLAKFLDYMALFSWQEAAGFMSLPIFPSSTSLSGTDTFSSSLTSSRALTGGVSSCQEFSMTLDHDLRLSAIVFPLKYHIHATSTKGQLVCGVTLTLTIIFTLIGTKLYILFIYLIDVNFC